MEWWNKEPEDETKTTLRQYRDTLIDLLRKKKEEGLEASLLGICFKYKLVGLAKFQDENDTISYKGYVKTLTDPEIKEYEAIPNKENNAFEILIEDRESPITVKLSNTESFGIEATFD